MLWTKNIFLLALPWLWAVDATAPFCQLVGAFVSNSYSIDCSISTVLILDHQNSAGAGLPRLRPIRSKKNSISHLVAASSTSETNHKDGMTSTKVVRRRKSWEESYENLKSYRDINGHCNVPQSEKPLGTWVNTQRVEHDRYLQREEILKGRGGFGKDSRHTKDVLPKTSMTPERKQLLDAFGFVWDAMEHTWSTRYEELCQFRKTNGHCVVPRSSGRLGAWVEKQRIEYKKYRAMQDDLGLEYGVPKKKTILTDDRVDKLDHIGFVWDVREKQFEEKLGQLRIFKEINGHIDPRYMNGQLAVWVRKHEQQYRKYLDAAATSIDEETLTGILPENRRKALEKVGYCRSMFDEPRARTAANRRSTWEERYEELREYNDEHGHCVVPKNYGPLGSWVRAQRHLMKEEHDTMGASFESGGALSPERVDSLNRLGFVWDVHQWQWNITFHELLQYKEIYGHVDVPVSYGGLGLWVLNQRTHYNSYRKGKKPAGGMTDARVEMLKFCGFEFDLGEQISQQADERWQKRLNELQEYKKKWGTFKVKQGHNPSLYNWCMNAKAMLKNSKMKKERKDALRSIGYLD